jgi:hypothetical protein
LVPGDVSALLHRSFERGIHPTCAFSKANESSKILLWYSPIVARSARPPKRGFPSFRGNLARFYIEPQKGGPSYFIARVNFGERILNLLYRMLAVIFIGTIFMLLGIFTRFAQSTDDGQTVERTTDRRSFAVVVVALIIPSQKHSQTTSGV